MTPQKFHKLVTSARKAGIISLSQVEVLAAIALHGGSINHAALAAQCGISRTGAAHITRRLHALEFIDRHVTQSNRADARITLSHLGRAWLESVGISLSETTTP